MFVPRCCTCWTGSTIARRSSATTSTSSWRRTCSRGSSWATSPAGSGGSSSTTWLWFTRPERRCVFPGEDHEHHSRVHVADLRATWSRRRGDADVEALVDAARSRAPSSRELWAGTRWPRGGRTPSGTCIPTSASSRSTARCWRRRMRVSAWSSSAPGPVQTTPTGSGSSVSSGIRPQNRYLHPCAGCRRTPRGSDRLCPEGSKDP